MYHPIILEIAVLRRGKFPLFKREASIITSFSFFLSLSFSLSLSLSLLPISSVQSATTAKIEEAKKFIKTQFASTLSPPSATEPLQPLRASSFAAHPARAATNPALTAPLVASHVASPVEAGGGVVRSVSLSAMLPKSASAVASPGNVRSE